jgi:hypothetical protein
MLAIPLLRLFGRIRGYKKLQSAVILTSLTIGVPFLLEILPEYVQRTKACEQAIARRCSAPSITRVKRSPPTYRWHGSRYEMGVPLMIRDAGRKLDASDYRRDLDLTAGLFTSGRGR